MRDNSEQAAVNTLVGLHVADVERDLILATLRKTGGNRTHAANVLGIALRTLRNKIIFYAAHGHDVPEPQSSAVAWSEDSAKATGERAGRRADEIPLRTKREPSAPAPEAF